jgi:release factor glutamine methyltransferase
MRLREWLAQAEAQLSSGPHPERARVDGETLLLHLIGKNKAWLMAHADEDFAGCTAIRFASLLERRRKGEPIQYITGEAEFFGLPFRVTRDVLIPRPETEHLVEKTTQLAASFAQPRIVDVGTGSGVIAIALAVHLPNAHITAIDISEAALTVARDNATRSHVSDRIRFLEGDLLNPVADENFDIVVSNPPYVPESDRASLAVEVRDHEPALALFASGDGLSIYRRLIPAAFEVLATGGFIVLEIGYGQQQAVRALLADAGFADIQFISDLQSIPRVAVGKRS